MVSVSAPDQTSLSMTKTLLALLLSLSLLVSSGQARTVNIDSSVACRPELLPFLPGRVREICSSLVHIQPDFYFNSGKLEIFLLWSSSSSAFKVKRDEGGNLDGPEHLFLRFGRSS